MSERPDYINTSPELWRILKPLARQKRHEPTAAEEALWQQLRGRRVNGLKFRRQHSIERFIVDFFCYEAKLIIEVDGEIHQYTAEEDAIRQTFLESQGFVVLRFTNDQVLFRADDVVKQIQSYLATRPGISSPSPGGEGAGGEVE